MPTATSNVSRSDFFTLDKLRLFRNYKTCVQEYICHIAHEIGQHDWTPQAYKDLCLIHHETLIEFVEEMHYMTEECVLPPCTPEEAEELNSKREELRQFAKEYSQKYLDFLLELDAIRNPVGPGLSALDEHESNLSNELTPHEAELAEREQREAELDGRERH